MLLLIVPAVALLMFVPRHVAARGAVAGTVVFLCLLVWLWVLGRPVLRDRLGWERPAPVAKSALQPRLHLHRVAAYAADAVFATVWAAVFVSVIRSDAQRLLRLLARSMGLVLALGLMLIVHFSAYLLPQTVTNPPGAAASTILRFVVLHVTLGPGLVALMLIVLAASCLGEI